MRVGIYITYVDNSYIVICYTLINKPSLLQTSTYKCTEG